MSAMRILRTVAICSISLFPVLGAAQRDLDFVGKWVVDREKMSEIDPAWDGVLPSEMWIVTGFRGSSFQVSRSIDDIDTYDSSSARTTISLGGAEGLATAQWEGERLVVRISVPADGRSFTRVIYREGQWLVFEDRDRPDARWAITYFVKS